MPIIKGEGYTVQLPGMKDDEPGNIHNTTYKVSIELPPQQRVDCQECFLGQAFLNDSEGANCNGSNTFAEAPHIRLEISASYMTQTGLFATGLLNVLKKKDKFNVPITCKGIQRLILDSWNATNNRRI